MGADLLRTFWCGGITFMETSWTRFLWSGLSNGMLSSGVPPTSSFPNMVPFSRIFLVRRRVSIPGERQKKSTVNVSTSGLSLLKFCSVPRRRSSLVVLTLDSRHSLLLEPLVQRLDRAPVAGRVRQLPDDESRSVDLGRLKPLRKQEHTQTRTRAGSRTLDL